MTFSAPAAEKSSIAATMILAAAAVILAGGSYFLVAAFMKPAPVVDMGPVPELIALASLGNPDDRIWTEAETAACKAAVNRQADADDAFERRMWNNGRVSVPSMAKGYSQGSARMACEMINKPLRLCDAEAKEDFVRSVKDYASRTAGFIKRFGLTTNLVSPALVGVALPAPAEPSAGLGEDLSREAIAVLANEGFARVTAAMVPIAEAGLLTSGDFGFMGAGVPPLIADMLSATPARGNACAV